MIHSYGTIRSLSQITFRLKNKKGNFLIFIAERSLINREVEYTMYIDIYTQKKIFNQKLSKRVAKI